ncbi:2,3-diaminopropionate biosynthesis protein SbnA [Candidatus Binatia bacterium]|nr:2,3-diaminopropionate biosynthesis protein SbnA [Candidatus Binatia bacterium]
MQRCFLDLVGGTPIVHLGAQRRAPRRPVNLFAKLEFYNPTGSIKDRPAAYILRRLRSSGEIADGSTVIESSSGNFGVALAAACRSAGLRFVCVVDPLLLRPNEYLLEQLGATIVKVTRPDENGGYLKARLRKVEELRQEIAGSFWVNQYGNRHNADAHYFGTGFEIYTAFRDVGLDYAFIPVSSGGTITGVSRILKEHFPAVKIIAVDTSGSVIFGGRPRKRYVPGMGSSIVPEILADARIDDVFCVHEEDMIDGCMELLKDHGLFVGASSGAAYFAAKQYFRYPTDDEGTRDGRASDRSLNVVMTFADRGERYMTTVYSREWTMRTYPECSR